MQTIENEHVTLQISGEVRIPISALAALANHIQIAPAAPVPKALERSSKPDRLAYTVKQTAELLSVSDKTVHRLLNRGLLKSSTALRHKLIPRSEIERFLKETSAHK